MTGTTEGSLLIVDDDPAGRALLRRVLAPLGLEVHEAEAGRQGVDLARELVGDLRAVLLDLRMPGELDGAQVAQELRGDAAFDEVPIVIVSASVHADARREIGELSCDAFLEKPIDVVEVRRVVSELASGGRRPRA